VIRLVDWILSYFWYSVILSGVSAHVFAVLLVGPPALLSLWGLFALGRSIPPVNPARVGECERPPVSSGRPFLNRGRISDDVNRN